MSVTIDHSPTCGPSCDVLGLIRNAGIEPVIVEYLKDPRSRAELAAPTARMGIAVLDLLRRRGTPDDEPGLGDPSLSDDRLLDAMMVGPIPIDRPIVVTERGARLCRPLETVLDILPQPQRGAFAKEGGELVIDVQGRLIRGAAPAA